MPAVLGVPSVVTLAAPPASVDFAQAALPATAALHLTAPGTIETDSAVAAELVDSDMEVNSEQLTSTPLVEPEIQASPTACLAESVRRTALVYRRRNNRVVARRVWAPISARPPHAVRWPTIAPSVCMPHSPELAPAAEDGRTSPMVGSDGWPSPQREDDTADRLSLGESLKELVALSNKMTAAFDKLAPSTTTAPPATCAPLLDADGSRLDVDGLRPVISDAFHAVYELQPSVAELGAMEADELAAVVGLSLKSPAGSIAFSSTVDVRGLDFEQTFTIHGRGGPHRQGVTVGDGCIASQFKRAHATVTLHDVRPPHTCSAGKFRERLKRACVAQGTVFGEYDAEAQTWMFHVEGF